MSEVDGVRRVALRVDYVQGDVESEVGSLGV